MIDTLQFSSWLVVALFLVAVGFLLSHTPERGEVFADRWERFSAWMTAHGKREGDPEEEIAWAELRQVQREERLRADLERLRHLIATDTYMSATRQIGNRIAYQQLLAEARACSPRPALALPNRLWAIEQADLSTTRRSSGPETLDIHWR